MINRLKLVASLGGASLCLFGLFKITKWVITPSPDQFGSPTSLVSDNTVSILKDFTSIRKENGITRWEFKAKQVLIEKVPGGSMSSVKGSTFTDISSGKLFNETGKFLASFSGRHAEIELQSVSAIPQNILDQYTVQWQIKLTDTVKLANSSGDNILTDSLAILNTTSKQTGAKSLRVLWEKGGVFRSGKQYRAHGTAARPDRRSNLCR